MLLKILESIKKECPHMSSQQQRELAIQRAISDHSQKTKGEGKCTQAQQS